MKRIIKNSVMSSKISDAQREYEYRKNIYLKRKHEFETLGEGDNNDVLSREEKMNIAKAEMDKVNPKSVKSAKDATFKNDKRLSTTSERYKGYLIVLDRGGDGYNVYDKHRELEDAGYPSKEAAKKFIDELVANDDVYSAHSAEKVDWYELDWDEQIQLMKKYVRQYKGSRIFEDFAEYINIPVEDIIDAFSDAEYRGDLRIPERMQLDSEYRNDDIYSTSQISRSVEGSANKVSPKHIKSSRNSTFQNDKRLSSTSTNVTETQMIDDLEYFYEVYPEAMEPILIRNGATPDKDNWLDGCNIPQAYDEAVAYFESKYNNDDEYSELDTGVGSRLGWSNYIQSGIYEETEDPKWICLDIKHVRDSDGMLTDYALYTTEDEDKYICMFGDVDAYPPDEMYADAEFDSEEEALEWFEDYTGPGDEDEDEDYDVYHDVIGSAEELDEDETKDRKKYAVHYTEVNTDQDAWTIYSDFRAQVSKIAPYDDADYAWADIRNGHIDVIRNGKVVKRSYYFNADDMDVENTEWCDIIIDEAIDLIAKINKDIEPRMVYNSTSIASKNKSNITSSADKKIRPIDELDDVTDQLRDDLIQKLVDVMSSPNFGFSRDEAIDYSRVDIRFDDDENRIEVEVGAEVDYDGLMQVAQDLDPIIQSYDKAAYFDAEDAGLLIAFIPYKSLRNHMKVNSASDIPEPSLDPPEYDDPEEVDEDVTVEFDMDRVRIDVDKSGSWEYIDDSFLDDVLTDNALYSEEYDVKVRDRNGLLEDLDDILKYDIPVEAGEYRISCHITLVYHITGIEKYDEYPDDNYGDSSEYSTENAEVKFDFHDSYVKDFRIVD